MKTRTILIAFSLLVAANVYYFTRTSTPPTHTAMPPGFILSCDSQSNYMAMRSWNKQLLDSWAGKSRQNAIDRAWQQYEYEQNEDKLRQDFQPCE